MKQSIFLTGSVSSELRDLENKRQRLQAEVATHAHRIDQLKLDLLHQQTELDRLKLSVEQVCRYSNLNLSNNIGF